MMYGNINVKRQASVNDKKKIIKSRTELVKWTLKIIEPETGGSIQ